MYILLLYAVEVIIKWLYKIRASLSMVQPQMSQHSYTYGYVMILYGKEMEISSTKIKLPQKTWYQYIHINIFCQ